MKMKRVIDIEKAKLELSLHLTGNFLGTEEKCQVIALTRRLFFVFKILTFAVGGKATSYS